MDTIFWLSILANVILLIIAVNRHWDCKREADRADTNYSDWRQMERSHRTAIEQRNAARQELTDLRMSLGKLAHPGLKSSAK